MCLIVLAWRVHPGYPLLLAANRDEFHDRPSDPLGWWADAPQILAGRDRRAGGSWLGVSRGGRMAAVTNVRSGRAEPAARSRGALVADFLRDAATPEAFAARHAAEAERYGAYNLLLLAEGELRYLSNRPAYTAEAVAPGVHALSNARLDTPWPKVERARAAMQAWIAQDAQDDTVLLDALHDTAPAADAELPDTGVGLEFERLLSPPFIRCARYGTRCTSLLRMSADGAVSLFERRYDAAGQVSGATREAFRIA